MRVLCALSFTAFHAESLRPQNYDLGARFLCLRRKVAKKIAPEYHFALRTVFFGGMDEWRTIVMTRIRTLACSRPFSRTWSAHLLSLTLVAALSGCTSPRDAALEEFARWHDDAQAQAQAGLLSWSELYQQSFDRLTALPPSLQQDTRLENTVLLLSTALKYEAHEITEQQFASEREHIETQLQARLR